MVHKQFLHYGARVQREQILGKPDGSLNPGPPEAHFNLDPSELREGLEKELQHLRQDKARLEAELHVARQQVVQNKVGCVLCVTCCQKTRKPFKENFILQRSLIVSYAFMSLCWVKTLVFIVLFQVTVLTVPHQNLNSQEWESFYRLHDQTTNSQWWIVS